MKKKESFAHVGTHIKTIVRQCYVEKPWQIYLRETKSFDSGLPTVIKSGKTGETQEALQLQGTHSLLGSILDVEKALLKTSRNI